MVTTLKALSKEENDAKDDVSMETTFYLKDLGGVNIKLYCGVLEVAGEYGYNIKYTFERVRVDFKARDWWECASWLLYAIVWTTIFLPSFMFLRIMERCCNAVPFFAYGVMLYAWTLVIDYGIRHEDWPEGYMILELLILLGMCMKMIATIMLGCSVVIPLFDFELLYPAREDDDGGRNEE